MSLWKRKYGLKRVDSIEVEHERRFRQLSAATSSGAKLQVDDTSGVEESSRKEHSELVVGVKHPSSAAQSTRKKAQSILEKQADDGHLIDPMSNTDLKARYMKSKNMAKQTNENAMKQTADVKKVR